VTFLATTPAPGQTSGDAAAQAEKLFAGAKPFVEEALGFRLEKAPNFRHVTTAELCDLPYPELVTQICYQFPDLRGKELQRAADVAKHFFATATVARYQPGSDVIHVLPENLPVMAKWHETLGPVNSQAFYQLALAHQVARLALDQRYNATRRLLACDDPESFQAMQSVLEGKARVVTRHVAKRLGTESYLP